MLFLLIPLTWFAVVGLFVALCSAASRSDAVPVQIVDGRDCERRSGLMLWDDGSIAVRASAQRPRPTRDGARLRGRGRMAHSVR